MSPRVKNLQRRPPATTFCDELGQAVHRTQPHFLGPEWNGFECPSIRGTDGGTGTGSGGGGVGAPFFGGGGGGAAASAAPTSATGAGTAGIGNLLPWLYPTADFKNLDKFGAVALPAIGTWADILIFSVDPGRCGKLTQLGIDFVPNGGAAYTQGLAVAQLKFFIGVNGSPATAVRAGKPFKDYESFLFLPGAVSAPTPINGLMLRERDEVHVAVFNVSIVVTTQSLAARVLGYHFAKKYWSPILGTQ